VASGSCSRGFGASGSVERQYGEDGCSFHGLLLGLEVRDVDVDVDVS